MPPGAVTSTAGVINNAGVILGWYGLSEDDGEEFSFLHQDGVTIPLVELTGDPTFMPSSLNDAGHIAGEAFQHKVRARLSGSNPDLANALIAAAAAVIGSLSNSAQ